MHLLGEVSTHLLGGERAFIRRGECAFIRGRVIGVRVIAYFLI